jgi:type IV secretory pathway TrbL component
VEILIVLAAILIVFVIFSWLFRLVKTTVKAILLVGFIIIALYVVFGIGPEALWDQIQAWLQSR